MKNKKQNKRFILTCIFIVVVSTFLSTILLEDTFLTDMKYTEFKTNLENQQVEKIKYVKGESTFVAVLKNGDEYIVSSPQSETFVEKVLESGVDVEGRFRINFNAISIMISALSVIVLLRFVNGKGMGGLTSMKNHKVDSKTKVSFADISCNSEIKKELLRIVDYLKRPDYYKERNAKMPNGILLYGPPGTGKTLLAKATAHEADCSFYALSGSDFVEMYVGRGAGRVRELFKEARENAPAIIFIDEIDAIGKKRGSDSNTEKDQTINALLNELDGFSGREQVIVIAATNDLESMDTALTRSGRFGKHIMVPLPSTKEERKKIINIHKVKDAYDETVDFDMFAKNTQGMSGADISAILNEALLISIDEGKEKVDAKDLDKAFTQHIFEGHQNEKKSKISEEEQRAIAYHEAGHAIIANLLCKENVTSVSIIGTTTGAGGFTIATTEEDRYMETKESLENRIIKLYAGRAAEDVGGFKTSVGAHDDIRRATELLVMMHNQFAMMDDNVVNYDVLRSHNVRTEDISERITGCSKELFERAKKILRDNYELLTELSETLLEKETLSQDEVNEIIKSYKN